MIGTWCHSQGERYHGSFDSREQAIEDGKEFYEGESFRVGQVVHALDVVNIPVDCLIETIDVSIYDETGFDDESTVSLAKEKSEELAKIIENFLRENAEFGCHCVSNIEFIRLEGSGEE